MRATSLLRIIFFTALVCVWHSAAHAQSTPSPRDIQALIANGQTGAALADLHDAIQAHPDSGVAWYLTAEAQDEAGNESAARTALANAEHFAPGLPFARPDSVAALRNHLAGAPVAPVRHGFGVSPLVIAIGVFVVLFLVMRGFLRRRFMPPQAGYGPGGYPGQPGPFGPGPGGTPYGQAPYGQAPYGQPMGGGLGSSIVTGLAAGAGFAAGERIVDGLMDGNRGNVPFDPNQNIGPMPTPDRDDGLMGSPNWNDDDDQNNNGGFDSSNDW